MITMMITKDDDKYDDKKLKDQSKNNSSESRSRFKVQDQDSRLTIQESREGLIKISMKSFSQKLSST